MTFLKETFILDNRIINTNEVKMSLQKVLYLIELFQKFTDQKIPSIIIEIETMRLTLESKDQINKDLESLAYSIKEYLPVLDEAGFKSHTIKNIDNAIIEAILLFKNFDYKHKENLKRWLNYIKDGLNAIKNILSVFIASKPRASGWPLDQLKRNENFLLIVHRRGATRVLGSTLERDVDIMNNVAKTVELHQKSFLRTVQVAMDCDFFWIEHNGKMSIFFGHPRGIFNIFSARKASHFMPLRRTTGLELPEQIFKRMSPALHLSIELKFGVGNTELAIKMLIDELNYYGLLQRVTFQSHNLYLLELVKSYSAKLPTLLFSRRGRLLRFHTPTHWTWNELFEKPINFSIPSLPSYVDGVIEHHPPQDILEFKAYIDYFKKHGKLCMPFIINFFMPQRGRAAKKRILQAYLAGCNGGFVDKSSVEPLIEFLKDPLG
jgi:hypothetical protein